MNPAPATPISASNPEIARPGYKTTEFYIIAMAIIGQISAVHTGAIPGSTGAQTISITAIAYVAARLIIKNIAAKFHANPLIIARLEDVARLAEPILQQAGETGAQASAPQQSEPAK